MGNRRLRITNLITWLFDPHDYEDNKHKGFEALGRFCRITLSRFFMGLGGAINPCVAVWFSIFHCVVGARTGIGRGPIRRAAWGQMGSRCVQPPGLMCSAD